MNGHDGAGVNRLMFFFFLTLDMLSAKRKIRSMWWDQISGRIALSRIAFDGYSTLNRGVGDVGPSKVGFAR